MEIIAVSAREIAQKLGRTSASVMTSLERAGVPAVGYGKNFMNMNVKLYDLGKVQAWLLKRGLSADLNPWAGPVTAYRTHSAIQRKRTSYRHKPFITLSDLCKATGQPRDTARAFLKHHGVKPYVQVWRRHGSPLQTGYRLDQVRQAYQFHSVSLPHIKASQIDRKMYRVRKVQDGA